MRAVILHYPYQQQPAPMPVIHFPALLPQGNAEVRDGIGCYQDNRLSDHSRAEMSVLLGS